MDDKRTLVAFLLIGAIFVLLPYYYEMMGIEQSQVEPEAVAEARRDSARDLALEPASAPVVTEPMERQPVTTAASETDVSSTAVTQLAEVAERRIHIRTPLQHLEVSTTGGAFVGLELPAYQKAHGGPVSLLTESGRGLVLTLESETGRDEVLDLSEVVFEPDRERVDVDADGQGELRLRADLGDGRSVVKTIRVDGGGYGIEVGVRLQGFDENTLVFAHWRGGIALAERDADLDLPAMQVMAYVNENLLDLQVDEGDEPETEDGRGDVHWVGLRNKYFAVMASPSNENRHEIVMHGRPLSYAPFREYEFSLGTRWGGLEEREWKLLLYAGPLGLEQVSRYERDFVMALDLGFPVIRDIAKLLLYVFGAAYEFIPNFGWVIVAFGVAVKILVYPLTHKSYESAAKMQEVQPKLAALKEKYKNNNQKLSQETMKLYKEEGVNPLGGCLPMVLQMPIFFALYQVFSNAIQLRQAPWMLWIDDLSLPDAVAVGGFELHILPLLMSGAMFFQSKMTMKDPKQAALVYMMPVVMVFIMWSFSSGLVLYWTVFNVMQIGQQVLTNHLKQKKQPVVATGQK
ncbi:MAG TPA: membrane protein insertase YidC [Candidatus Latescibacteria bacterium]|nr:membrane protein insertase YidC [Candidatus Latescibacterota bacterium]HJP33776.1 membrane protein insertase YidC [Candidatus Latescibacterota bacterium]